VRRLGVIVLAAGRGARFGGPKQLAVLEGRPLISHVLAAVAAARPRLVLVDDVVVVLGHHGAEVERVVRAEPNVRTVRNPDPSRGLASSLRVGLGAMRPAVDGALVALADQPRLSSATIEAVANAWAAGDALVVLPRHAADGVPNPALIDRRAWPLARSLKGDRGMSAVLEADPNLALVVDVPGANPDVDTPADLAAL
jgi:molybdenum cofactor cytidylyltransferase